MLNSPPSQFHQRRPCPPFTARSRKHAPPDYLRPRWDIFLPYLSSFASPSTIKIHRAAISYFALVHFQTSIRGRSGEPSNTLSSGPSSGYTQSSSPWRTASVRPRVDSYFVASFPSSTLTEQIVVLHKTDATSLRKSSRPRRFFLQQRPRPLSVLQIKPAQGIRTTTNLSPFRCPHYCKPDAVPAR